jgi:hypothetical protein
VGNDPPGGTRRNSGACSLRYHYHLELAPYLEVDPVLLRDDETGGSQSGGGHLDWAGPLCALLIVSTSRP